MKKEWKYIIIIAAVILALPVILVISTYLGVFGHLQTRTELLNYKNATATQVLSAEGKLIGNIFSENRTNISFAQVPKNLIDALIATEDYRFYEHKGIDARSLFRVLFKSVLFNNPHSGGGSTISQQLAKNMFGRNYHGRFSLLIIKIKETILASRLEKTFSKQEILTLYLNTVSFGENIFGIETAARRYFNIRAEDLKYEESAVLIGMLKANTWYNPRLHPENALSRRNVVFRQMQKYKYLNQESADSLCKRPLLPNYSDLESDGPADYFLVRVRNEANQILHEAESGTGTNRNIEEDGLIITTTLNLTLQKYALESFREHLSVMQKRLFEQYKTSYGKKMVKQIADQQIKNLNLNGRANEINLRRIFDWNGAHSDSISVADSLKQALLILHAGLIAIDPATGSILAWVGGVDFKSQPYDQVYARRQMASLFKPVLYAEAFEQGMNPCDYLDNDSSEIAGMGDWSPENYNHTNGGKYSLAGALAQSMNIPTVNLFLKIGFEPVDSLWRKMGFSFTPDNTPSLALGTAECSIAEAAIAYSAFANGGYKISPQSILSIKTHDGEIIYQNELNDIKKRILTGRSAVLISSILQKAVNEGTGASLRSVYGVKVPLGGKTGTSQNYSDAWFAAFNPKLVIVTRVGASSRVIHFNSGSNGSGSTLALPLVALTMKKLQNNDTLVRQFIAPFPDLPPDLADALNCPDFKENNLFDKIKDLFHNKKGVKENPAEKQKQKKKGFFKRLFGR